MKSVTKPSSNPDLPDAMTNADFLRAPLPEPLEIKDDLSGPARFFNRELSALAFNQRVLEEAENAEVPLLERVRFLSISSSNLDEFFAVRLAGLRGMVRAGISHRSMDGRSPTEQLQLVETAAREFLSRQQRCWMDLRAELAAANIRVLDEDDLKKTDTAELERVFLDQIFPILTPLAIDPAHPFPFIPSGGFAIALRLKSVEGRKNRRALLPIPGQIPRFIRMPDSKKGKVRFLPLELALLRFVPKLFPGMELVDHLLFSIIRDSDLELEEDAEDLVREFEDALKRLKRGDVVRMKVSTDAPAALRDMMVDELGVHTKDLVEVDGLVGLTDIKILCEIDKPELKWPGFVQRLPERVLDHEGDIFAAVRQKDMLLHHPYETFNIVVRYLQQAARDPDVVAIKQTLYRTSLDSPIVAALCEAVVYGFMEWKTHAKLSTVVRREGNELATYTHVGTGNYHPITANFYTDLALFTCDRAIGRDAARVFNYVSGYAEPDGLENLTVAPRFLKPRIITHLEKEMEHARAGRPAQVWAKLNGLMETEVIDALYRASQAGVKIDLIVRGICGLRPGIKGLSENIRVKSIVGRFLEHGRVICFGNGHGLPSNKARVYIASADWMERNLNRRVEVMAEITNPTVHDQVLDQIMGANMADTAQSWVLQPDGTYLRHEGERSFNCHKFFMENPSLSGRGRVGIKDVVLLEHSQS